MAASCCSRQVERCVIAVLWTVLGASAALAQTWDGGGANNNWTTAANWNPDGAPVNNGTANIIMAGTVRLSPIINVSQDILSLTFDNTAGQFTIIGAKLTIRGGGITNNDMDLQSLAGDIVVAAPQTWQAAAGPLSIGGVLGVVTLNANLIADVGTGFMNITPVHGSGSLTKDGAGVLNLGGGDSFGTNSYNGDTTINAGTLRLQADYYPYPYDAQPLVIINPGAVFDLNNFSASFRGIRGSDGSSVILGTGSLGVYNNAPTPTFNGVISGSGDVDIQGPIAQPLGGANTYTGRTLVYDGILQITADERLADESDLELVGGTFDLQTFNETVDIVTMDSSYSTPQGGSIIGTGTLSANLFQLICGSVVAPLGGPGDLLIDNNRGEPVTLTGVCTYAGETVVHDGSLVLGASNVLPDTTHLLLEKWGTLDLGGFSDTVEIVTMRTYGSIVGKGTLTAGEYILEYGDIDAVLAGSGAVTKIEADDGPGYSVLRASNTYTGGTNLNGERLVISSDANLGFGGPVTFDGGTLETYNSPTLYRRIIVKSGGGTIWNENAMSLIGSIEGMGELKHWGFDDGTLVLNVVNSSLGSLTNEYGPLELLDATLDVAGSVTNQDLFIVDGGLIAAGSFVNNHEMTLRNDAHLIGPMNNDGYWLRGDGRIDGPLSNAGGVSIGAGESLHFAGAASHYNAGGLYVIDGEIAFDAALVNAGSIGSPNAGNAVLRFDGGLTNDRHIHLSSGTPVVYGKVTNSMGGEILIDGDSETTFFDEVINGGTIEVLIGSTIVFFRGVSGVGSFPAAGTGIFEGDLLPGASLKETNSSGDIVFGSASKLKVWLRGVSPDIEFGRLVIGGTAFLDGTLSAVIVGEFSPVVGDSFEIMTFGSRVGLFSGSEGLGLGHGLRLLIEYSDSAVTLTTVRAGDSDLDSDLDLKDFAEFQRCFGVSAMAAQTAPCVIHDFNADGRVDASDHALFIEHLLGP